MQIRGKSKLGEIINFINGRAFKPSEWELKGTPIIRIQNLNGSKEFNFFNGDIESKYIVKDNQLLFSWSGSRGTSFGPHIWSGETGVLNQHIFRVVPKKKINEKYLYYELKRLTREIEHNAHGSAGLVHITKGDLEQFEIYLPEEREQEKIAKILSTIDLNIEKTAEAIAKYKQVKKGLMDDLLTGKIRIKNGKWVKETEFKYVEGIGNIPKEWEVYSLDELTKEKIKDGTHSTPMYLERGVPFLRVTDIQSEEINFQNLKFISKKEHEELTKRTKPELGDILYSKNGTIGIAKLVEWNWEFSIFVSLALIKPDKEKINNKFLEKILNSFIAENQIKLRAKQGTVTNLHLEEIREFLIPCAEIKEQNEISDILEKQEQLIEKEEQYLKKLQKLKSGLMDDLLTGRKRVNID
ncbi:MULTISPECIES: restriction endonuclease subunit S [Clostridium]|uniref:restriction endonuclease subunit S n=1 Tax=Clostridium TaxID=1485 RepID=UPI0008A10CE1|nr:MULTISPECIES: restriction endonuclease subunit S [Clostridium]MDB2139537.1 restriction endonuclease subunit S [Clostridium butyricum]MDU4587217.1 restriction endonuclease subunit S [Clostridium sp.]OFS19964.1 hypothetical protein HMPREF3070_17625 [Clostridium sp. HMSC19A10]